MSNCHHYLTLKQAVLGESETGGLFLGRNDPEEKSSAKGKVLDSPDLTKTKGMPKDAKTNVLLPGQKYRTVS